jgi:DNA-binding PadR family transcriptional regulator
MTAEGSQAGMSPGERRVLEALAPGPALAAAIGRRAGLPGGGHVAPVLRRLVRRGLAETWGVVQMMTARGRETVAYAITDASRAALDAAGGDGQRV